MKSIYFLFCILVVSLCGCKITKPVAEKKPEVSTTQAPVTENAPAVINYNDQATWLLGYFKPDQLTHYPYSTWYITGFDDYQLKTDAINNLLDINKDNIAIKVVMGTWCPDSRREVPRFMRVLNAWQFPEAKVTFIGVDDAKLSPVGEYMKLDILRVPTFIIYKNNIEAGRIIENPTTSLEQDMVNILSGMKSNK
jgi:thiol-disulfide isomerase/thioredoxin